MLTTQPSLVFSTWPIVGDESLGSRHPHAVAAGASFLVGARVVRLVVTARHAVHIGAQFLDLDIVCRTLPARSSRLDDRIVRG